MDDDHRYRAVLSRDSRFDGAFVTAVVTTGIYCRPSCPARTPGRGRVRFFSTAAAAEAAGFRACKRCRPDAAPGSPEWNVRGDRLGRALRLIGDGVIDRCGVAGLAQALCLSERQLHRLFVDELGVGPLSLARTQRAATARALLEGSDLSATEVAFAAGFSSVRSFNETIRRVFRASPSELRQRRGPHQVAHSGLHSVRLRLAYRPPIELGELFSFLALRAVPGLEEGSSTYYRRALSLAHGDAVVTLSATNEAAVGCEVDLEDLRDLGSAVARCRRLLDLDADPAAIAAALGEDPLVGPVVRRRPGRRLPGHVDGAELAVRVVCGERLGAPPARGALGRILGQAARPLRQPRFGVTHAFPPPEAFCGDRRLPLGGRRTATLARLCAALAGGDLDLGPGADRARATRALAAIEGLTATERAEIARRGLCDPDALAAGEPLLRGARHRLPAGLSPGPRTERWRPYRAYGLVHLAALAGGAA